MQQNFYYVLRLEDSLLCLLTTQLHENFICRCLTPASKHESCQKEEQELKTNV